MKTRTLVGCVGILALALALVLAAGSADALKRDVIADAAYICDPTPSDPNLALACDLVWKTNGEQIIGNGCLASFDAVDNRVVDYLLRNCDQNEEALLRKASSAVLSLNDVAKGKIGQLATAVDYLCSYITSYELLVGAGKLASTEDLAADAQDIVTALGSTC